MVRFNGSQCRHFAATTTPGPGAPCPPAPAPAAASPAGPAAPPAPGVNPSACVASPAGLHVVGWGRPGSGAGAEVLDPGTARVSIDFRCALEDCFDSSWKLPGVVFRHEMRRTPAAL